jgi:hypothetical protein
MQGPPVGEKQPLPKPFCGTGVFAQHAVSASSACVGLCEEAWLLYDE